MEHLYKTQEEEFEKELSLDFVTKDDRGNFLEKLRKSHTIELFKRFKEILEGEKKGKNEDDDKLWAAHYLGHDEALSTAIAEVDKFITSISK